MGIKTIVFLMMITLSVLFGLYHLFRRREEKNNHLERTYAELFQAYQASPDQENKHKLIKFCEQNSHLFSLPPLN